MASFLCLSVHRTKKILNSFAIQFFFVLNIYGGFMHYRSCVLFDHAGFSLRGFPASMPFYSSDRFLSLPVVSPDDHLRFAVSRMRPEAVLFSFAVLVHVRRLLRAFYDLRDDNGAARSTRSASRGSSATH